MNWINKLTLKDNKMYTVLLCLHVADPATSLASNSILGLYFLLMDKIHISEFVLLLS